MTWLTAQIMKVPLLWLRRLLFAVLDHWKPILLVIATVAVCLFARCAYVNLRTGQTTNSLNGSNANQSNINAGISVLGQQQANAQKEFENANSDRQNTNAATKETLKRDSSTYSGTDAGNRFCEKFPNDSTCQQK